MTWAALLPPTIQAIGNKIARLTRRAKREPQLVDLRLAASDFQNAKRHEQPVVAHIVISGPDGLNTARHAASTERTNLYFCLGIERNPQALVVLTRRFATGMDVGEDVVGLGNFFLGTVFTTRRSR